MKGERKELRKILLISLTLKEDKVGENKSPKETITA
jgi:hypothetical protein